MNTSTFIQLSDFHNFDTAIIMLDKIEATYKIINIKDKIKVISIEKESLKYSNESFGKGKYKLYYSLETDDVLLLDNMYGFVQTGQPYETSNDLSILKLTSTIDYSSACELSERKSILEYEREIKSIFGISISKNVKYSDIYEFVENKPSLFSKYVKEVFEDKTYFASFEFWSEFGESEFSMKENITFNKSFLNFSELSFDLQVLWKKINPYLDTKLSNRQGIKLFNELFDKYMSLLNFDLTKINYHTSIYNSAPVMLFSVSENNLDNLEKFAESYSNYIKEGIKVNISYEDGHLFVSPEKILSKHDIIEIIESRLTDDSNVYETDVLNLISLLDDKLLKRV